MRASYEAWTMLELGARGQLEGSPFTLAGRTCVRGRRGAVWNEWRLDFDDGEVRFLAEMAGALTLYEEGTLVPSLAQVTVGGPLDTGFVVIERGEAMRVAHWGAADDAPATYGYVDLSGRSGELATIDYGSDPPRVFVGRKTTAAALGLATTVEQIRFIPTPEVSRPKGVEVWLTPGDVGELDGTRYRVLGMVSRSMGSSDGDRVRWDEYVLFDPVRGFRWLVVSDGHWSLVEPIEPGRVEERHGEGVVFEGVTHEPLSKGVARVDWATGELPWAVAIGETSNVQEFVHAPWILTRESTVDEITWSRGTHLTPDAIVMAFGKRPLPRPKGRAANEI